MDQNLTKSGGGGGGSWTCEASDPEPGFIWGGGALEKKVYFCHRFSIAVNSKHIHRPIYLPEE